MKTKVSTIENWTFKRFMRVSVKLAFIYLVLSFIWILIFGNTPEIIWKIRLENNVIKELPFIWNSWSSMLPNLAGIILLGALAYCISKIISLVEDPINSDNDLSGLVWFSLIMGLIISFIVFLGASFIIRIDMGIIVGLALGTGISTVGYLILAVYYGLGWVIKQLFLGLWWIIKNLFLGLWWVINKIFSGLFWVIKKLFSTKPMIYITNKLVAFWKFIKLSCVYIWNKLVAFWKCLIK